MAVTGLLQNVGRMTSFCPCGDTIGQGSYGRPNFATLKKIYINYIFKTKYHAKMITLNFMFLTNKSILIDFVNLLQLELF